MVKVIPRSQLAPLMKIGWRVLDVGAGDDPFYAATVLLDRTPRSYESALGIIHENTSLKFIASDRASVVGDMHALPFRDASFDFVFASHVVEHSDDPTIVLKELSRVAPRGYLECPRPWFEFVDTSPFHRWFVDLVAGELIFRPKAQIEMSFGLSRRIFDHDRMLFDQLYGDVFRAALESGEAQSFGAAKAICHLCVYWEGTIEHSFLPAADYG